MFCPKCGSSVAVDARFCQTCGAAMAAGGEVPQPSNPATPDRKPTRLVVPGLIGAIALLTAGLAVMNQTEPPAAPVPIPADAPAAAFPLEGLPDSAEDMTRLREAADKQDPIALYHLGELTARGFGIPLDVEGARQMLQRSFELGNKRAAARLSYSLWHGVGGPSDPQAARRMLAEASAANALDSNGLYLLGQYLYYGWGGPEDRAAGASHLRRVADGGNHLANYELGTAAETEGRHADALKLWLTAARAGHAEAAYDVYRLQSQGGTGVVRDHSAALQWLNRAARQGNADAQAQVGYLYLAGEGLAQNDTEGLRWSWRAALAGSPAGLANVSYALEREFAREPNRNLLIYGYAFANLSAAGGSTNGRERRDRLSLLLNEQEREAAEVFQRQFTAGTTPFHKLEVSGTGTGFWVAPGRLVTNEHVVGECAKLAVRTANALLEDVTLLGADAGTDLAVLAAQPSKPGTTYHALVARLAKDNPTLGEPVTAFGYPLSGMLSSGGTLTNGTVSALTGIGDDPDRFQFSAPVQPGNSGGAVLNEYAEVVGVVQAVLNPITQGENVVVPQNVNFAIRSRTLRGFLAARGAAAPEPPLRVRHDSRSLAAKAQSLSAQVICYQSAFESALNR